MSYSLVLTAADTLERAPSLKDVGDNVFVAHIPAEYRVFAFYYPSALGNPGLIERLRQLGEITGHNLFVNIGKLNDPSFAKVSKTFEMRRFPVVVMTASAELATSSDGDVTSFIRIDNRDILSKPDEAIVLIQELHNLFITGAVSDAMAVARRTDRRHLIRLILTAVATGLTQAGDFIDRKDISVSLLTGTFELKSRPG